MKKSAINWKQHFNNLAAKSDDPVLIGDNSTEGFLIRYQFTEDFFNSLNLPAGYKLLDCGCGIGAHLELAKKYGYKPIGFDSSEKTVEQACKNGHECVVGDASELPFENSVFDVVISIGLLSCLESPEKFFTECSRVLKPGGKLLLITLYSGFIRAKVLPFFVKSNWNLYDTFKLHKLLVNAGLSVTKTEYLYVFPRYLNFLSGFFNKWYLLNRHCKWLSNNICIIAKKM